VTALGLERDVLVVACAISAGIHAALVRDHFAEGAGAGAGFLLATVALVFLVVALGRPTAGAGALAGAAAVLAGLLASYGLAITTGIPLLHPRPDSLESLALTTKAVEALGLLAAARLLRDGKVAARPVPLPLPLLIALFSGLVAVAVSGGHGSVS
jgi:hypothetical protein